MYVVPTAIYNTSPLPNGSLPNVLAEGSMECPEQVGIPELAHSKKSLA